MKKLENTMWGIVLIIIGLILGANALNITNIDIFFDGWWTLFIIIPCFIGLFNDSDKTGNLIGLLVGVALLLGCQDVLNFDIIWRLILPLILVIIGISIIFKDALGGKVSKEIKKLNKNKEKDNVYSAMFSSQNINFNDEKFDGCEINAIFGGFKCDLRNAKIDKDIVINASSIFGGIDILVPDNVKVIVKSTSIFGGVENKVNNKNNSKTHAIYVNATVLFGGVDIK